MGGVQASHRSPFSPMSPPTSQGDLSSKCWTPELGHPMCGLHCSLPREDLPDLVIPLLFWVLSQGHRSWLDHVCLFLSYSILCVSFLQPWLYKSLSASLQLVFSENCFTCRCIFDVFMGGSWVLCPPTPPSYLSFPGLVFKVAFKLTGNGRGPVF